MDPSTIIDELSVRIYQPPLSDIRDSGEIADPANPLCVLMLLIDFRTEIEMNGISDFIGNSTGLYAAETVVALDRVGCPAEADKLRKILAVAASVGMTHDSIQAERAGQPVYSVTTFRAIHGEKWADACDQLRTISRSIDFRHIFSRAEEYVAEHRANFDAALAMKTESPS